ncbi:MAG: oligoendopeptidase F family protein, partial [Bacilli bacterium]|nr:oligoendopeptidase F family protein [Bacilli bacterium]
MKLLTRDKIKEEDKWNLNALYDSDEKWNSDIKEVEKMVNDLLKYKGNIMKDSNTLLSFYEDYEKMDRLSEKVYMYASLLCDSDTLNNEYKKKKDIAIKMFQNISSKLSFVSPEMLAIKYEVVENYIKENDDLKKYKFDLEKMFRYEKHTLSKEEEQIITEASNAFGTGNNVFYNFDNADVDLGFITDEDGKKIELTHSNYSKYMLSKDENVRRDSFEKMFTYYKKFKNTITEAYKGTIKEDFFYSKVKKYESPLHMSLYADNIDVSVYKNIIDVVHDNFNIMHDYIALRKKVLNLKEMHMYDIYIDLASQSNKEINFHDGKKIILEALKPLGEDYLNNLKKAFSERWIDKYPNKGKKSGAYSWGCYDSYPYLLLNYNNDIDSVTTMAHELGHSMHSYLSNKNQDHIYASYPIFLAEIASTVNEVLLNDYLYKNAKTKNEKIYYLTDFLDKVRTTIYRQTQFAEFEMLAHDKYAKGIP